MTPPPRPLSPPFRITICGLAELGDHAGARVTHVLSILDPDWPVPEAFGSFGKHEKLSLRFHDIIQEQPGEIAPQPADVAALLAFGRDLLAKPGAHLLVHCHAGISRSSASMALLLAQAQPDAPATEIFAELLRIRPRIWPNLRILEFGDRQLGRGGELAAAVAAVYRHQLAALPHLAVEFRGTGRGREVDAAGLPP